MPIASSRAVPFSPVAVACAALTLLAQPSAAAAPLSDAVANPGANVVTVTSVAPVDAPGHTVSRDESAPQPNVTSPGAKEDYRLYVGTDWAFAPGVNDVGNHCDNCGTTIALPFPVKFYDQTFQSLTAYADGFLHFGTVVSPAGYTCSPAGGPNYVVAGYATNLRTDGVNSEGEAKGIYTSVSGASPNRIFNIEWRATDNAGSKVNFEIRLYERHRRVDIVYGKTGSSSVSPNVGVKSSDGARYTSVCGMSAGELQYQQYTFVVTDDTPGLLHATDLPKSIGKGSSVVTTIRNVPPDAASLSVAIDVSGPSPRDLVAHIFPGEPPPGPISESTGWPRAQIWFLEPLVDQAGQPTSRVTAALVLPPELLFSDTYTVFVRDRASYVPSGPGGTLLSCSLTINPANVTPPTLTLDATNLHSGDPVTLVLRSSASSPKSVARIGVSKTWDNLGFTTALEYQQLASQPEASLAITRTLDAGRHSLYAKAVDSSGAVTTLTTDFWVNKPLSISTARLDTSRNSDWNPDCFNSASINFTATLNLKNFTARASGNLRLRFFEVAAATYIEKDGPPPLPAPTELPGGSRQVNVLAPGASQQVTISGRTSKPQQVVNPTKSVIHFHVYAVLEEEFSPGQWVSINSFKFVDGELGCPPDAIPGPGGGVNDPPASLTGTAYDPYALDSLAARGPTSVNPNSTAPACVATVRYRNSTQTVTKDLVPDPRLEWSVSDPSAATIDSNGVLHPASLSNDRTIQVQAAFTFGGARRSASLPVTIVAAASPPVITSPGTATSMQGQPFAYQITASGNPTSFAATGLPAGLSINTSTGLISGTPLTHGSAVPTIFATNPSGTVSQPLAITILPPARKSDFNGDAQCDFLWQNTRTGERVMWLLRNGVYQTGFFLQTIVPEWRIAGTGDLNGDSHGDFVWQNLRTGEHVVWFLRNGQYQNGFFFDTIPPEWQIASSADLNGDAHGDFVWQNTRTGEHVVWFLRDGRFQSGFYFDTIPPEWEIASAADFNADGHADFVWQNTRTGEHVIWMLRDGRFQSGFYFDTIPPEWRIAGAADFNADGHADFVWQNINTGERVMWFLRNGRYQSGFHMQTIDREWDLCVR